MSGMTTSPRCPICGGETHEIRAKLHCRQCGTILETCCEGGPMAARPCDHPPAPTVDLTQAGDMKPK